MSTSQPKPPASQSSLVTQLTPPAPKSLKPIGMFISRAVSRTFLFATVNTLFKNGSGTWTEPLFSLAASASKVADAKAAPPMPLQSVGLPTRINSYCSVFASAGTRE